MTNRTLVRIAVVEEEAEDFTLVGRNQRASERALRATIARYSRPYHTKRSRLTGHPNPMSGDPDYSAVEVAYLKAVEEYQRETGCRFLTCAEYLALAVSVLATIHDRIAIAS